MQIPIILNEGNYEKSDVDRLRNENKIWNEPHLYEKQLEELFDILNPQAKLSSNYIDQRSSFINQKKSDTKGNWIYFPWNGYLIHTLNEKDYFLLRTNRNQLLITKEEQKKLQQAVVGFVGLSIGSHFAAALAYSGIANTMKLAEFDNLETSNLNRVRAGIKDIGRPKIEISAEEIYEINPYANLKLFEQGLNDENLENLLSDPLPLMVFEAIDDFQMKIKLRLEARKKKIAVIMLTNLGDSILIDIERFDQNPNLPLFNGLLGNTPEEILSSSIGEKEKVDFALKIVGRENVSERIMGTMKEINKTLVGRPQLYSTVSMAGGLASYLARKIILGENTFSNRAKINFDMLV